MSYIHGFMPFLSPQRVCSRAGTWATVRIKRHVVFTQRKIYTEKILHTDKQMPKLLHRHVFTHRGIYTKVLHTDAADASAHRSFWTQMPLHTEAFTERRFDIYTPMHTEAFRHRLFSRESQKLWHREAFTQRIFYTQKLLHTHKLFHRSLYTRRLLRTEAFTERSLYTQTLSHRKTDFTEQLLHTRKNRKFTYVFDVRPSYRAKGLRPALENRNFWRWTIILRERVVPDLVKCNFTQVLFRAKRLCLTFQNG